MGHIYAMERNGVVSFDLTINGWLHVILHHEDVKNYQMVYSENEVPALNIEGHTVPQWIRCDIEFNNGRVFQGIRAYYREEAENTAAWDHRPSRILSGRAVAIACRFGLQVSLEDEDETVEVKEVEPKAEHISFDDDEQSKVEAEEVDRLAAEEATQREAERLAAEEAAQREAEEAERLADEEAAQREAEEAERLAAEEAAQREAEEAAQREAEEAERLAAEEAAQREAEEAERLAAEEAAQREAESKW